MVHEKGKKMSDDASLLLQRCLMENGRVRDKRACNLATWAAAMWLREYKLQTVTVKSGSSSDEGSSSGLGHTS